jgi:hypothetical protein
MSRLICISRCPVLCKPRKNSRGVLVQAAVLALLCARLTIPANTAFAQQGTFVPTGSMNAARTFHTATLLNSGMILIAGGDNAASNALADAELYDPTTGTFTPTGSMNAARTFHTATLLNNGMVLIAGGNGLSALLASAELYNPATGTFTLTGSMNTNRSFHTATLLSNGMVLIAGGVGNSGATSSAELYNPATGTFTLTGSMNVSRYDHTATLLNNGMVLIAAGQGPSVAVWASAELYDPTTGTFTPTGSMNSARSFHTATLLSSGMVLIAGGSGLASAELYNPASGTFTPTGSMNSARTYHTATLLNNGMALIAGGSGLASAELYNPAPGTFISTGSMNTVRSSHSAVLLNSGIVLIAGGYDGTSISASAELYELVIASPTSLSFSGQVVGTTSASQTVTLTNNQSTALSITGIAFSGTNASDFAETDNCIGSVAAAASCSINVTFTPAGAGSRTGNLNIANNISGNLLTVPLTGTGEPPTKIASLSTNSLTFTNQMVGFTSPAQGITLSNTGNSTLTISGLAFSGTNASEFAETDNCVGNITAAASCTINVTFSPTATGTRTGTLSITDNATSPSSPQTVALTGTATAQSVSVTPSSIAFPAQFVGTSGLPQSVTVMNNGNAPLSITSVTTSATDFGTLNACGNTVAVGSSCAIGVFFDPTTSGTRSGTLTINDNAPGSPQTVALSGTGQDFSLTPVSSASTTVSAGQTAIYTVAVSPAGGFNQTVALSCNGAPAQSTCLVSPNSISFSGTSAVMAMVTIKTMRASSALPIGTARPTSIQDRSTAVILTWLGMLALMVASLVLPRREQRFQCAPIFALGLLVVVGIAMASCGGGGGGGGSPATQPGTYPITVSGNFTSGSTTLTRSTNLTLVVVQ